MGEFGSKGELHANVLLPVSERIPLKTEDRLHWIAQDAGSQTLSGEPDNGVLDLRAILILIDNQAIVSRRQNVCNVSVPEQHAGSLPYLGIMNLGIRYREDSWLVCATFGKERQQPHAPAVDRSEAVVRRQDARFVQSRAESGDTCVGVSENEDWLRSGMARQRLRDEMCFAASRRCRDRASINCEEIDVRHLRTNGKVPR
jgi:hypothetical protein